MNYVKAKRMCEIQTFMIERKKVYYYHGKLTRKPRARNKWKGWVKKPRNKTKTIDLAIIEATRHAVDCRGWSTLVGHCSIHT